MKRISWLALFFVLAVILVVPTYAGTKITPNTYKMVIGQTKKLKINTKKSVKWSSSNKKVATVSNKGVVRAKKSGNAKIYAKVNGKKYSCLISVYKSTQLIPKNIPHVDNDRLNTYLTCPYGSTKYESTINYKLSMPPKGYEKYLVYPVIDLVIEVDTSPDYSKEEYNERGHLMPSPPYELQYPYFSIYVDGVFNQELFAEHTSGCALKMDKDTITKGKHTVEVVCFNGGGLDGEVLYYKKLSYKITPVYEYK